MDAKASAKDDFIDQERRLRVQKQSDTVVVLTVNYADWGSDKDGLSYQSHLCMYFESSIITQHVFLGTQREPEIRQNSFEELARVVTTGLSLNPTWYTKVFLRHQQGINNNHHTESLRFAVFCLFTFQTLVNCHM
ncbi:hypothetical protein CROQUDRAFT_250767 [Cronartium quercuum f. sp. fusiforme G11]|uniref:Uncharacterized protein n=1 Tax=Cronartium quercuum f. sp. fusiforme G11 TaxID=708437 RepID=A0A9P6NAP4_9BASI|nr:hypothetical protein CROQUDRAFT_250767 [Cronartium quercuum f. sp. fusiforme G11]